MLELLILLPVLSKIENDIHQDVRDPHVPDPQRRQAAAVPVDLVLWCRGSAVGRGHRGCQAAIPSG